MTANLTDLEILEALKSAIEAFPPTHPEAKSLGVEEYEIELELRKARSVLQAHCLSMTETNWRKLCQELLQGLDENRHPEVRYPGHLRLVMAAARSALAQPEPAGAASRRD